MLSAFSIELDKLHVDPKTRLRLDHLIALLRLNHAISAPAAAPIVPAAPENPPAALPASQEPCIAQDGTSETRRDASPDTSTLLPDSQNTASTSMGGYRAVAACNATLNNPPVQPEVEQQQPVDPPPHLGQEARSLSLERPWELAGAGKLTKVLETLVTRLERLENNRFAVLSTDTAGPPPPAPSSYAARAAAAAPLPAPTRPAAAPAPAKTAQREVVVIATSTLAADHPLRTLPPSRLLTEVRALPPLVSLASLVHASRLERGNVLVAAASPSAASLLRRAVASSLANASAAAPPEKAVVLVHHVPANAEEEEMREKAKEWAEAGEEEVRAVRRLGLKPDARFCSWLVELWDTSAVTRCVSTGLRKLREEEGVWVEVERGLSRGELRERREKREAHLRSLRDQHGAFPTLSPELFGPPRAQSTPSHTPPSSPPRPRTPPAATAVSPLLAPTLSNSPRTGAVVEADSSIETTILHVKDDELPPSRQPALVANASWDDETEEYNGAGARVVANAGTPEAEREWRRKMGPSPFRGPLPSFSVLKECFMDETASDAAAEEGAERAREAADAAEVAAEEREKTAAGGGEGEQEGEERAGEGEEGEENGETNGEKGGEAEEEGEDESAVEEEVKLKPAGAKRGQNRPSTPFPAARPITHAPNDTLTLGNGPVLPPSRAPFRPSSVLTRLLASPACRSVDLLLLQEPPSPLPPLSHGWSALPSPPLPPQADGRPTRIRSVALIPPRLASSSRLLPLASPDTVVVEVELREEESVRVVGMYNASAADALHNRAVEEDLPRALALLPPPSHLLLAGDFNLHHPLWERERTAAASPAAETLIAMLNDHSLTPILPPGTTTFFGHNGAAEGCNDLFFASEGLVERVVSCGVDEELVSGSDHLPLRAIFAKSPDPPPPPPPRFRFRKADVETALLAYRIFASLLPPPASLKTIQDLEKEAERLTFIASYAALAALPLALPGSRPRAHEWWCEEIAAASEVARVAESWHFRLRKRRMRGRAPLAEVEAARRVARSRSPAAASPRPMPSPAPSPTPTPAAAMPWPELREKEVREALFSSRPFAAPSANGLPNSFLQLLWPLLRLCLVPLYASLLRLGHLPAAWRDAVGLVLRKPKKPDYSVAKAYRLIAFERTLANV
ncbi:hypothetical protein JCM10213_001607 [Rhodosporidiobolus nylandii]